MTAELEPAFVEGPNGPLFVLRAEARERTGRPVLLLPPFAEEMNRSRRFLVAAARTLARHGCAVTLPDLSGTGDSAGSFAEATWEAWCADAVALIAAGADKAGRPVELIGLRTGALLAAEAAAAMPDRVAGLTCLQPVRDGASFLDQLLRVRVAASMSRGRRDTRGELRAAWAAGRTLEIGGYEIGAALAEGLDARRLAAVPPPADRPVRWLSVVARAGAPGLPVPETWPRARLSEIAVAAPSVWALAEPVDAPALVERLIEHLTPHPSTEIAA